jgi:hypothetical protein
LDKVNAKSLGVKTRKGMQLNAVEAGSGGQRTVVYYLTSDNLAKQAEISYADSPDRKLIIDTKALEIAGDQNADLFAFKAPAGSKELTADERNAGKWYESVEEGMAEAKKTGKLVMIDFSAVW